MPAQDMPAELVPLPRPPLHPGHVVLRRRRGLHRRRRREGVRRGGAHLLRGPLHLRQRQLHTQVGAETIVRLIDYYFLLYIRLNLGLNDPCPQDLRLRQRQRLPRQLGRDRGVR